MFVNQLGYQDYYFDKFDEWISVGRPSVMACNLIIGTMYVDVSGECDAMNHKTGERAELKFNEKGWSSDSTVSVKIYDSFDTLTYTIEGSWLNSLYLVSCQSGQKELLWQEDPPLED